MQFEVVMHRDLTLVLSPRFNADSCHSSISGWLMFSSALFLTSLGLGLCSLEILASVSLAIVVVVGNSFYLVRV